MLDMFSPGHLEGTFWRNSIFTHSIDFRTALRSDYHYPLSFRFVGLNYGKDQKGGKRSAKKQSSRAMEENYQSAASSDKGKNFREEHFEIRFSQTTEFAGTNL